MTDFSPSSYPTLAFQEGSDTLTAWQSYCQSDRSSLPATRDTSARAHWEGGIVRITWSVSGGIDSPNWNGGIADRVEHKWSRRRAGFIPNECRDRVRILGGVEHVRRQRSCWDGMAGYKNRR